MSSDRRIELGVLTVIATCAVALWWLSGPLHWYTAAAVFAAGLLNVLMQMAGEERWRRESGCSRRCIESG